LRLPCAKVPEKMAQDEISRLRKSGSIIQGYRIRREGKFVLIPVRESPLIEEFEEVRERRMKHVGSFERVSDFFIIKEREGWEEILSEIKEKQNPRAVFLDRGVKGSFRIRNLELVYGSGDPVGIHRENGFRYFVDLRNAYFSPRLASIRKVIVENVLASDGASTVVDLYAGVGPIAIPISRKRRVVAVDINPHAVSLMRENARINRTFLDIVLGNSSELVSCFSWAKQVIMNNPTQPPDETRKILKNFSTGTTVHMTVLQDNDKGPQFEGWKIEDRKVIHGYSPSSSLFYYRLIKKVGSLGEVV